MQSCLSLIQHALLEEAMKMIKNHYWMLTVAILAAIATVISGKSSRS